jgi:ribosomal protein S28E/S33
MASDVTAATTGALVSSAASDRKIKSSAGAAAAGAAESQASIPYIGLALAIAAAAAIFGLVMGFRGKSAAGGWWQIPSDTMAMVHKDEMVLPSHLAEGVRSVVEGGGGGGRGSTVYNVNISALDGADVRRVLTRNSKAVVEALREAHRNGPVC